MKSKVFFIWMGLFLALPSSFLFAHSQSKCEKVLERKAIKTLLEPFKDHPLYEFARTVKFGRGMRFYIDPVGLTPGELGEGMQGVFLKNVLKTVFPRAAVRAIKYQEKNDRAPLAVHFTIRDSAEINRETSDPDFTVEMIDIKPANIRWRLGERARMRNQIGLDQNRKVAHVYLRRPWTINDHGDQQLDPDLETVAKEIVKHGVDDVIFSSTEFDIDFTATLKQLETVVPEIHTLFKEIRPVSGLLEGNVSNESRTLYLNDTRGRMSDFHAISDFTLIMGPINFFESLQTGTETFVLINSSIAEEYAPWGINRLLSYGKVYSNLRVISRMGRLRPTGRTLTEIPEGALRPLENLLTVLHEKINAQLNRPSSE